MKRIVVLISGGGTNLQGLIDTIHNGDVTGEIVLVISNEPDAYGLQRAKDAGIPVMTIEHRSKKREDFEKELLSVINARKADLVCLAGWMRILSKKFVEDAPPMMNIHPALLPSFGGKGMYGHHVHEAVIRSGDKVSGATVHFVSGEVDAGPIILQRTIPVMDDDTPDTLAARVLIEEHKAYPEAVSLFLKGELEIDGNKTP